MGAPSKSSGASSTSIGLIIDEEICFDKPKVAKKFNDFFTTIASTLVAKLPQSTGIFNEQHVKDHYKTKNVVENSLNLTVVSEDQVLKIIHAIGINKATGLDNLPSRFIKDGANQIISPLTHILNLSMHHGQVPGDLKYARVVPIYKKSSKTDEGNYRPVSVLSIVSKIMERVVYNQVEAYLGENSLLYDLQSGFRPGYSTDSCLIYMTDYIRKEMDKGNYTGMVLLDLQKAFDTVNHEILLYKLKACGMNDKSVKWFSSYLSHRKQVVDINGTFSEHNSISCGVPQGSILGPLLFTLYVNDMQSAVSCKLLLYADDSALMVSGKNVAAIQAGLSRELEAVSKWLVDNKLSLHLGKTESILFGTKRKLAKCSQLGVTCNGINITASTTVKYLGANLDQAMSGEPMGDRVIKKSNSRLKFLYRKGKYLNFHAKKLLSTSLIQCHYDYACSFWYSGLSVKTKNKLQTSQNKLIRFMLDLPPRSHVGITEISKIGWLPVETRVNHIKLCHMYKIINGLAPEYLGRDMVLTNQSHGHFTRHSRESVVVPRFVGAGHQSFIYTASKCWNSLPPTILKSQSLVVFKQLSKKYLRDKLIAEEISPYTSR